MPFEKGWIFIFSALFSPLPIICIYSLKVPFVGGKQLQLSDVQRLYLKVTVTVAVIYSNTLIIVRYVLLLMNVTFYRYVHSSSEDSLRRQNPGVFLGNLRELFIFFWLYRTEFSAFSRLKFWSFSSVSAYSHFTTLVKMTVNGNVERKKISNCD